MQAISNCHSVVEQLDLFRFPHALTGIQSLLGDVRIQLPSDSCFLHSTLLQQWPKSVSSYVGVFTVTIRARSAPPFAAAFEMLHAVCRLQQTNCESSNTLTHHWRPRNVHCPCLQAHRKDRKSFTAYVCLS